MEEFTLMKKLLTLLFTFALAFTLAMPAFAQEPAPAAAGGAPKAEKKEKKAKKEKKSKKEKKESKDEMSK